MSPITKTLQAIYTIVWYSPIFIVPAITLKLIFQMSEFRAELHKRGLFFDFGGSLMILGLVLLSTIAFPYYRKKFNKTASVPISDNQKPIFNKKSNSCDDRNIYAVLL